MNTSAPRDQPAQYVLSRLLAQVERQAFLVAPVEYKAGLLLSPGPTAALRAGDRGRLYPAARS